MRKWEGGKGRAGEAGRGGTLFRLMQKLKEMVIENSGNSVRVSEFLVFSSHRDCSIILWKKTQAKQTISQLQLGARYEVLPQWDCWHLLAAERGKDSFL